MANVEQEVTEKPGEVGVEEHLTVVGGRFPDVTGVQKLTGQARFVSDVSLPGMLIGKVLHSPHAHARILGIDTSEAESIPGVKAVVTFKDAPKRQYTGVLLTWQSEGGIEPWSVYDVRVLEDRVRYVGDAVAAVAAVDELTAEQAIEAVKVEYEVLPAVFDEAEATAEGAPPLHERVLRMQPDGLPAEERVTRNLAVHVANPPVGDAEQGLRESTHVAQGVGFTSKQRQAPLETFHCVAHFEPSGRLTVWAVTQQPFMLQSLLAYLFDMPAGMVRVRNEFTGGAFGAGTSGYREPICVLLAHKTGRPVKLLYSRQEDFVDRPTRSQFGPYKLSLGVDKDGSIVAMDRRIVSKAGAHLESAALCSLVGGGSAGTLYRTKHFNSEAEAVYTNKCPCGAMRGFGNPEETFVREQVVDMAAELLGIDALDFRLQNLSQIGDPGMFGPDWPIRTMGMGDCLRIGAEKIGWKSGRRGAAPPEAAAPGGARRRGIGVSCMAHTSGAWPVHIDHSGAAIKFIEDGSIVLTVWPAPIGSNCFTSLAQIAAEVLGMRFEDVHVAWGDTDTAMFEVGSYASRTMYTLGNAVSLAALDARRNLLERAAQDLGSGPEASAIAADDLDIRDRAIFVKHRPETAIQIADVVKRSLYSRFAPQAITGTGSSGPKASPSPYQALFAEVEVDTETGEVDVLRIVVVNDSGRPINPMTVEGQIEGGTAQGLGYALYEDPVADPVTGKVLTDDFDTYKIPTTLDMPPLEITLLEQPEPTGPFGAKGVGEPGCINQAPAIANAIYDAVGVRIWTLPMTPEKIITALREKDASTSHKISRR